MLWVIQDSEIEVLNLCRWSCAGIRPYVILKENLVHVRMNSSNVCFQFLQHSDIVKNSVTAHCIFCTDILHCTIFTAIIQRLVVAELQDFTLKCWKA
jgi:hypothetical protein